MVPAVEALHARFDLPISIDTWRASVARACYAAGAVVGNDISGFADPDYLPAAAEAGASVVATHIRLAPRVPDPDPVYDDVVLDVRAFLPTEPPRPRPPASRRSGSWSTPVSTSARASPSPSVLLRIERDARELGYPVFLSASNKRFLWNLLERRRRPRRQRHPGRARARHRARVPGAAIPRRAWRPAGWPTPWRRSSRQLRWRPGEALDRRERPGLPAQGRRRGAARRRRARARAHAGRRRRPHAHGRGARRRALRPRHRRLPDRAAGRRGADPAVPHRAPRGRRSTAGRRSPRPTRWPRSCPTSPTRSTPHRWCSCGSGCPRPVAPGWVPPQEAARRHQGLRVASWSTPAPARARPGRSGSTST